MATSTDVNICNIALTMVGDEPITALTDVNKRARVCNAQLDNTRKEVLRNHSWRSAKKRVTLTQTSFTISAATWLADVATITTTAAHGLLAGDKVTNEDCDVEAYNVSGVVLTAVTNMMFTFALDLDADPGNGTTGTVQEIPVHSWAFMFRLPSDWLRFDEEAEMIDFVVEGRKFLSDDSAPEVIYVHDISDWDVMDESLKQAIAAKLAVNICVSLVGEKRLAAMQARYLEAIENARFNNAIEASVRTFEVSEWLDSRI